MIPNLKGVCGSLGARELGAAATAMDAALKAGAADTYEDLLATLTDALASVVGGLSALAAHEVANQTVATGPRNH